MSNANINPALEKYIATRDRKMKSPKCRCSVAANPAANPTRADTSRPHHARPAAMLASNNDNPSAKRMTTLAMTFLSEEARP